MKAGTLISLMVAAVALQTLSIPKPAFSEMRDMSMTEHKEGHGQMMDMGSMDKMDDMMGMCVENADKIGLADDQLMKMNPKHSEMQKKHAQYKADVKIAEIELMDLMEVKDFDLEKARSAVKKIAEIKTTHQLEMLKSMKEMRTMLTDEQFMKMKKLMATKMRDKEAAKMMMNKH